MFAAGYAFFAPFGDSQSAAMPPRRWLAGEAAARPAPLQCNTLETPLLEKLLELGIQEPSS